MRFQVPQFIEVEDKIFGPLTFKQFVYLVGGAGIAYLFFELLPLYVALIPMLVSLGLGTALAFYKVNSKPFIEIVRAALKYVTSNKIYIWKKREKRVEPRKTPEKKEEESLIPRLSDSKLKEISWSLGVKDSIYAETQRESRRQKSFPQEKRGSE